MPSPIAPFTHAPLAQRVVFGPGVFSALPREAQALGARRVLVLSTPGQRALAERAGALLGPRMAAVFDRAAMHVPRALSMEAVALTKQARADGLLAAGGGSTIGLAKAIALETGLPIMAVPTTYAGSEATPIHGSTHEGRKTTGRDPRVLPRTVLYDPELSTGLALATSVTSAINALAHAAEGLYAPSPDPVMGLLAEEGIAVIGRTLPRLASAPADIGLRGDLLYGAWLCGTVLGNTGMGLHHKLCHTLGGSFNLPHAETHAIVLPHALAYNASHAPQAMARIARALGATDAPQAVHELARGLGAPLALRDIGLRASDLDAVCALALQSQYPNPRPLQREPLRELLQRAFEGAPPGGVLFSKASE